MPSTITTLAMICLAAGNVTQIQQPLSKALIPAPSTQLQVWQKPSFPSYMQPHAHSRCQECKSVQEDSSELVEQVKTLVNNQKIHNEFIKLAQSSAIISLKNKATKSRKKQNKKKNKKTKPKTCTISDKNRPKDPQQLLIPAATISSLQTQSNMKGTNLHQTKEKALPSIKFMGSPNKQSTESNNSNPQRNQNKQPEKKSTKNEQKENPSLLQGATQLIKNWWDDYKSKEKLRRHRHHVLKRTEFWWLYP